MKKQIAGLYIMTLVISACGGGGSGGGTQNIAPIAVDDSATTTSNTPITFNVQSNDSDTDGTIIGATLVSQPTNGTLSNITSNGNMTYSPNNNFTGNDNFTYTVQDDDGDDSNIAMVNISVTPKIFRLYNTLEDVNGNGVFDINNSGYDTKIGYQYDANGNVVRFTQDFAIDDDGINDFTFLNTYNSDNQLVSAEVSVGNVDSTPNPFVVTGVYDYFYNADGKMSSQHYTEAGSNNTQVTPFIYDANGNLPSKNGIDILGNVVGTVYTYDNSNRVITKTTIDDQSEPLAKDVHTYSYDSNGVLQTITLTSFDENGNQFYSRSTAYIFDSNGKLLSKTPSDSAMTTYTYDPQDGYLTQSMRGTIITYYSWAEANCIETNLSNRPEPNPEPSNCYSQ